MHQGDTYTVRLFLGRKIGYTEKLYDAAEVVGELRRFFDLNPDDRLAVRVSDLTFVAPGHVEPGVELAACDYPRYPIGPVVLVERMTRLARHLMQAFSQERVTLETPFKTIVLEKGD